MFGFFRTRRAARYPAEGAWTVLQGKRDGKPMFVRRNDAGAELMGHPDYRHRIGVAVPLRSAGPDGLPATDDSQALLELEEALTGRLEKDQASLKVACVTTGGLREFVFYSRTPDLVASAVRQVRTLFPSYQLQYYVEEDPTWAVYRRFR